jgi:hypothetical protein
MAGRAIPGQIIIIIIQNSVMLEKYYFISRFQRDINVGGTGRLVDRLKRPKRRIAKFVYSSGERVQLLLDSFVVIYKIKTRINLFLSTKPKIKGHAENVV